MLTPEITVREIVNDRQGWYNVGKWRTHHRGKSCAKKRLQKSIHSWSEKQRLDDSSFVALIIKIKDIMMSILHRKGISNTQQGKR